MPTMRERRSRVTLAFDVDASRELQDVHTYAASVAALAERTPGVKNVVLTVVVEEVPGG